MPSLYIHTKQASEPHNSATAHCKYKRGTQQLVGQQGTIRQQESASSELTQWAFGFGEMGDERKTAKAKATTRHCFMYNESLELTAPQHTAVKT
jgi:hypothetical protein